VHRLSATWGGKTALQAAQYELLPQVRHTSKAGRLHEEYMEKLEIDSLKFCCQKQKFDNSVKP